MDIANMYLFDMLKRLEENQLFAKLQMPIIIGFSVFGARNTFSPFSKYIFKIKALFGPTK